MSPVIIGIFVVVIASVIYMIYRQNKEDKVKADIIKDFYERTGRKVDLIPCGPGLRDVDGNCVSDPDSYSIIKERTEHRPVDLLPCSAGEIDVDGVCAIKVDPIPRNRVLQEPDYTRGTGYATMSACREVNSSCSSDNDGLYYPSCKPGFIGSGPNCKSPYCPDGYIDDGTSCNVERGMKPVKFPWDRATCKANEEMINDQCYPKCPAGSEAKGTACWTTTCMDGYIRDNDFCKKADVGIKKAGIDRYSCKSDEELLGAMCYPQCKVGYSPSGTMCKQI